MENLVNAYILIGGESSRMKSPKGNLILNGKSFIENISETLQGISKNIFLVGDKLDYDHLQIPRINDHFSHIGPISGIHAALKHSSSEWNFILSCDIPLLSPKILHLLLKQIDSEKRAIVLKDKKTVHPLIGLYPKAARTTVEKQINIEDYKLKNLLKKLKFKSASMGEEFEIQNINKPQDYKRILQSYENKILR
tara:strand:+ start:1733 stop:2317 length:585 start_codon:yes stop_codon:yes gene_type:complete